MGLEEQIKQTKFASEREKAIVNISFTQSYLSSLFHTELKEYNISLQQFNVLRILKGQHPKAVSINEINARMIDKMSNCSRLVDKLYTKSLVKRETCSYDKRQLDISLTPQGIKSLNELNEITNAVINRHDSLTDEEYKQLNTLLNKMRNE